MDTLAVLAEHLPELPTVQVEAYTGRGATGDQFATAVAVEVVIDRKRRQVRGDNATVEISETMLIARVDAHIPVASRITLPDGTKTVVITVARFDDHGQPELPAHLEVLCQ